VNRGAHRLCAIAVACLPTFAAAQQTAVIPPTLVGVWKGVDVPGESRDVVTGATIALIGWHAQLELAADGRYTWTEYREGEIANCRISTLRKTAGLARVDGATLTLGAAPGSEAKQDGCNRSASYSNRPVSVPEQRLGVNVAWTALLSGFETLELTLTPEGSSPLVLHYTDEAALDWPAAAIQPIGAEAVPAALPSLWVWPAEIGRFATETPFTSPKSDAHWARFTPDGRYEWAGWKDNIVPGPGCAVGVLAYERGRYHTAAGPYENVLVTEPDSAAVLQRRSGCGAADGDRAIRVPLHPSRYSWSIGRTPDGAEVLEVKCAAEPRERNRWQFLLCHWVFEFRSLFARTQ
jgi:hypothetical protein